MVDPIVGRDVAKTTEEVIGVFPEASPLERVPEVATVQEVED